MEKTFTPKIEPRAHQRESTAWLFECATPAVLDEQGLGKTKSVIDWWDKRAFDLDMPEAHLVVCPKSVIGVWEKEVNKFSSFYEGRTKKLIGPPKKKAALFDEGFESGIFIINFEGLASFARLKRHLHKVPWATVVVDESTRIKTPSAQCSKFLHQFPKRCPAQRVILTGSPVTQTPLDLWSQYRFLCPDLLNPTYFEFRNTYAVVETKFVSTHKFQQVVGYRNLKLLRHLISTVSIRHTKDSCLDLPPKTFQRRILEWNKKQKSAYRNMKKDFLTYLEEEASKGTTILASNALSKLQKMRQICQGWVYDSDSTPRRVVEICTSPKLQETKRILDECGPGVIIWAEFTQDIRSVVAALKKAKGGGPNDHARKWSVSFIDGSVDEDDRNTRIDAFQDGNLDILVCQLKAVQYGVTLHRAHTVIYYGNTHSVETRMQSEDRCHRIGMQGPVTYIDLCMGDSVDEKICDAVTQRIQIAMKMADIKELVK